MSLLTFSNNSHVSIYSPVNIIETEASIRVGLNPHDQYRLEVEHSRIVLYMSNTLLWMWPLKNLRRYGYTSNSFSLEAGSRCASGAGMFIFKISNHQSHNVYETVLSNVAKIKSQQQHKVLERSLKCRSVPEIEYRINDKIQSSEKSEKSSPPPVLLRKHSTSAQTSANRKILQIPHYEFNNTEYASVMKKKL